MPLRLSFDPAKDVANIRKHGLSLADAQAVYLSECKLTFVSDRRGERRKIDLAQIDNFGPVLALVYVERDDEIRVISFRRASKQERRSYATAHQD